MEELLKYLSEISLSIASMTFIFGVIKWIDQRKREIENSHYQAFHKMVCIASGTDENGKTIKMAQQVAAIYQLKRYKEYSYASIPTLKLLVYELGSEKDERINYLKDALLETILILEKK